MVDALRRTRRLLKPDGDLIDIHPTSEPAHLEVGAGNRAVEVGDLYEPDAADSAWRRHADADASLAAVVAGEVFALEAAREFSFRRYGDTLEEMSAYVTGKWRNAYLTADTLRRARAELEASPGASLWVREQVSITKLRPR